MARRAGTPDPDLIVKPEAVLFDFFGTLVDYEPDRANLRYPRSHDLLVGWGHDLTYDEFVEQWDLVSTRLEALTAESHQEFSMGDVARAFADTLPQPLPADQQVHLSATFLAEWQNHLRSVPGAVPMVSRLARSFRLGIISNTHDAGMVPELLETFDIADKFEIVVLSVEHTFRKPHPSIYRNAVDQLGCDPSKVAFAGDSYEADFQGPQAAGMTAYLIDPGRRHPIPLRQRLRNVLDLESRLT
jgi:putative hydrolase of the HAD superfamily